MAKFMTRTIHPVGQGAFYTEEFVDGFTTVYDCGSVSQNVSSYIGSASKSLKKIDLLFISHFHQDHINKVMSILESQVSITRLVIPYYPIKERLLLIGKISMTSANAFRIARFILSPRTFLRTELEADTRVSAVSEIDSETPYNEADYNDIIPSGQSISIGIGESVSGDKEDWLYIPFNIKAEAFKNNAEEFYRYLVGRYPKFNGDITIINQKDFEDLRNSYREFFHHSNLNETSMPVFSTPAHPVHFRSCDIKENDETHSTSTYRLSSCLYTGDFQIVKFSMNELDKLFRTLSQYKLGMIQVPHHGSKTSYKPQFWEKVCGLNENVLCFISHANMYRHPYQPLVSFLRSCGLYVVEVTDNPSTMLQAYIIKK